MYAGVMALWEHNFQMIPNRNCVSQAAWRQKRGVRSLFLPGVITGIAGPELLCRAGFGAWSLCDFSQQARFSPETPARNGHSANPPPQHRRRTNKDEEEPPAPPALGPSSTGAGAEAEAVPGCLEMAALLLLR